MARFTIEYDETFTVRAPAEMTRTYFGDLDRIAENLEEVERVEKVDPETMRVRMEPLRRGPVTFHGEYQSRYFSPAPDRLQWEPNGTGNIRMRGQARFTPRGAKETSVEFHQSIEAEIEMNWLLSTVATPIVTFEMQRRIRRYLERARHALESGAGK